MRRPACFRTDPERSVSYLSAKTILGNIQGHKSDISTPSTSTCGFPLPYRLTNEEQPLHCSKRFVIMGTLEERVAASALRTFDDLPKKSKPRIHPDGSREWVPMSAVVLVRGIHSTSTSSLNNTALLISHKNRCELRF